MRAEGKETFPSQFGRYTLVERLATGGMAEVFKAKIVATHGFEKLLVIKRILPQLAADKTFVSMFIDEAKLTAQLVHPKIVQVIDFGEENGQYFIALEFVEGFDALALLRTSAQRQIRLPVPICMFIAIEVLDALDYAHNAKDVEGQPMRLVHRDISPSNVFISRRGDVKLGDFGIAHAQDRESKTQAGTLKGKYGYMSPEQVLGAPLDDRSDLFAVGIVMSEMLMGRRLFTAPNDLDVLLMVRDGRLDRLDKYCRHLPPDLDHLVRRALKRKPAERFQSAAEFRDALADLLFRMGFRIGPPDVGRLAQDYFDPRPEATQRLHEQAQKYDVRTFGSKVSMVEPVSEVTPAPTPITTPSGVMSRRAEWGLPPTPTPPPPPSRGVPALASEPTPEGSTTEMEMMVDMGSIAQKGPALPPPIPGSATGGVPSAMMALDQALSQPLAVVDLDDYEVPPPSAPPVVAPPRGTPTTRAAVTSNRAAPPSGPRTNPTMTTRPADNSGDLSVISALRAFADLAVTGDTGLLRLETTGATKEIYLVRGSPESVASGQAGDRFGEYLVARGFLRQADLANALSQLPRFSGKLGDTLVGMGLMRPLDVFRLLSQHVRERVIEVFTWGNGTFGFFRGVRNPTEAFPLGLDSFEILGASVVTMSIEFLHGRFSPLDEFRPRAVPNPRIKPEAFKLGTMPREVWAALDGRRSVREWNASFKSAGEQVTFMRTLYLLLETDLVRLE